MIPSRVYWVKPARIPVLKELLTYSTFIVLRKNIVDALNIAPQLGVIQTGLVLNKCLIYGIQFNDFANIVYEGSKWKKWLHNNDKKNKYLCTQIAGHYHFASDEYKKIVEQLNVHEDISENIIETIMEVIDHYESSI